LPARSAGERTAAGAPRARPGRAPSGGPGAGEQEPRRGGGRRRGGDRHLGGEQVEGRRAVRELLAADRRRVHEVIVAWGRDESPLLDEIAALARDRGVRLRRVEAAELDERAVTDAPQGVIARAEPVPVASLDSLLGPAPGTARPGDQAAVPFLVALDGVTDPRNLGSVLRTALGAGATGALLPAHHAARLSPAATKSAAGAIEHLPIGVVPGIPAGLDQLRRAGIWSVGLDPLGGREIDALEIADQPLVLVLGAEGRGLGSLARRRCDVLARISLHGPLDSLNVAAAAAVACFTIARRRAV
jgi:23S rRNA (guanosine2251-2'-O)-methyltransferase